MNANEVMEMAEEICTKEVKRVKNTPLLRISRELKWIGVNPDEKVIVAKIGDLLIICKK